MKTDPYWRLEFRNRQASIFRKAIRINTLRLQKVRKLKAGKQGTVTLERDKRTNIEVVVKRSELSNSVGREKRAARKGHRDNSHPWGTEPLVEFRVGTLVSKALERNVCPNLVMQYEMDVHLDDGLLSSVLEKFDGTLSNLLDRKTTWSEKFWYSCWFQLCAGMITLHRNGVTHTDLHLANIFYKKIKSGGYWTYVMNGTKYYVPNCGYVFAIADYGRARSVTNKARVEWHLRRVAQKIRKLKMSWEAYDYYKVHTRNLHDILPFTQFTEFNVLDKKGVHPVEKALARIFKTRFRVKTASDGICLGTYHIQKKINLKDLKSRGYLESSEKTMK